MTRRNYTDWADDNLHPTRGPKGDTAFLKDNYRTMGLGSFFHTPKTRFTPEQIHAGAKKAGFVVLIEEKSPWLKVTAVGKTKAQTKVQTRAPLKAAV